MSKSEAGKQAGATALRRAVERFEQRPAFAMAKIVPVPAGRSNLFSQFVAQHNPDSRLTNRWWVHAYSPLLSTQVLDRQIAHRYSRLDRSPSYLQLILRLRPKPPLPQFEPEAEPESIVERSRPSPLTRNYEPVQEYYPQLENQTYPALPEILQRSEADFSLPSQPPSRFEPERFLPSRPATPDHSLKPATADFKPPVLRSLASLTDNPATPALPAVGPSFPVVNELPAIARAQTDFNSDTTPLSQEVSAGANGLEIAEPKIDQTILSETVLPDVTPVANPIQTRPSPSPSNATSVSAPVRPAPLVSSALRQATTPTALMRAFERLENVTPSVPGETSTAASIMQMPLALSRPAPETSTPANSPASSTPVSATVRRSRPQPQAESVSSSIPQPRLQPESVSSSQPQSQIEASSSPRLQPLQPEITRPVPSQIPPQPETTPVRPGTEIDSLPGTPPLARASESQAQEIPRLEPATPAQPSSVVPPVARRVTGEGTVSGEPGASSGNAFQPPASVTPATSRGEEPRISSSTTARPEQVGPVDFPVETPRSGFESEPDRGVEIRPGQSDATLPPSAPDALARALERTIKPIQPPNFLPGNFLNRAILPVENRLFTGQPYPESIPSEEASWSDVPEMNLAQPFRQPVPGAEQPVSPANLTESVRQVARSLNNEEVIRQPQTAQPSNVTPPPGATPGPASAINQPSVLSPDSRQGENTISRSTPVANQPVAESQPGVEAGSAPASGALSRIEPALAPTSGTMSGTETGLTPVAQVAREILSTGEPARSDSPGSSLATISPFFLSTAGLAVAPGIVERSILPQWASRLPALRNNPGLAFDLQTELLQSPGTPAQFNAENVIARLASDQINLPAGSVMALARVLQRTRNPLALAYSLAGTSSEAAAPANLNLIYRLPAFPERSPEGGNASEVVAASGFVSRTEIQRSAQPDPVRPVAASAASPSFTTFISGQPSGLLETPGVARTLSQERPLAIRGENAGLIDTLGVVRTPVAPGLYWPSSLVSQNLNPAKPGVIARAIRRMQNPLTSDFYLPSASFFGTPNFGQASPLEMTFALPQFSAETQVAQPGLNSPPGAAIPGSSLINRASPASPDVSFPAVQRQFAPRSQAQPDSTAASVQHVPASERPTETDYRAVPGDYSSYEGVYPFGAEDFATASSNEIFVPQMPLLAEEWTANLPALRHRQILSRQLAPEGGQPRLDESFASPAPETFEMAEVATPVMPLARVLQRTNVPVAELSSSETASMAYAMLRRSSGNVESASEPSVSSDRVPLPLSNEYRTGAVTRQSREVPTLQNDRTTSRENEFFSTTEVELPFNSVETGLPQVPPLARAMERREDLSLLPDMTLPGFAAPEEVQRNYTMPPLVWRKAGDYAPPEVAGPIPATVTPGDASITGSPSSLARAVMQPVSSGNSNLIQSGAVNAEPGNSWTSNLPALRHNPGFLQPESETPSGLEIGEHILNAGDTRIARSPEMVLPGALRSSAEIEMAQAAPPGPLNPVHPVQRTTAPQTQPSTRLTEDRDTSQPSAALSPATAAPIHPSSNPASNLVSNKGISTSLDAAIAAEATTQPSRTTEPEANTSSFAEPVPMSHPAPWIQRKASGETPALTSTLAIGAALSPATILRTAIGKPLERKIQEQMGAIFRTRLEHVRVHTDEPAANYTRQMGAEAMTIGSNILFAPGRYQPETPAGQALIGHELTHVVQQANLPSLSGGRIPETSSQGQALEHEAIHNEKVLLRHLSSQQSNPSKPAGETSLGYTSPSSPNGIARSFSPVEQQHLRAEKFSQTPAMPTNSIPAGIQREMEKSNGHRASAQPIQRVLGEEGSSGDVQAIAREVYRLLKQQLQVDRERSGSRGGSIF